MASAACGSPCSMAGNIRVTSLIPRGLPRGEPLVSLGGGRKLARVGLIDRRTIEVCSPLDATLYACHPRLANGYHYPPSYPRVHGER
jgi:hypothetical protein